MIYLDLLLGNNPKNSPPHGIWLAYGYGRSQKNSATTPPPPTECARLTAIPENVCYYPPPTESARFTAIPENFCYYPPPPPNLVGLRRSRKIGPPQKKILATPLFATAITYNTDNVSHQTSLNRPSCRIPLSSPYIWLHTVSMNPMTTSMSGLLSFKVLFERPVGLRSTTLTRI